MFGNRCGSWGYVAIRLVIAFAPIVFVAGCEPKIQGRLAVEVRQLQDEPCEECISIRFRNAYTESNLLVVRPEPDFVLSDESFSRIDAVSFNNKVEERVVWKAEVSLTPTAQERVSRFRAALGSTRRLLLISVGGHPIDVMMSGQLVGGMFLGSFESSEELRAAFATAGDRETSEIIEASANFQEMIDRLEGDAERDVSDRETIGALVDALIAGDSTEAGKLQAELESGEDAPSAATPTQEP